MRAGCREISLLHWQGPLGESSRYFQIWPGDFINQHRSRGGAGCCAAVLLRYCSNSIQLYAVATVLYGCTGRTSSYCATPVPDILQPCIIRR
jgi:hypothetical protein